MDIYVEPVELRFDVFYQIEPFFITMAIYDKNTRERITENFSVDVNYDVRQMMKGPVRNLHNNSTWRSNKP